MHISNMDAKAHWENIYKTKEPTAVSWYQDRPEMSLRLIEKVAPNKDSVIIDIGGGASTLVDHLVLDGYTNVAVLDISEEALKRAILRIGRSFAERVNWFKADITDIDLIEDQFDVWHDRAVFHFLTQPEDRKNYVDQVQRALKPGGHAIIATFAVDGPQQCSGLDVRRYSPEELLAELGSGFELLETVNETHQTPFGTEQKFIYCVCRKV
jgi:ubiquinone/menaquinone biosynthesis C-methylase UbiE